MCHTLQFFGQWFRWERRQVSQIFRVNDYIRVLPGPSWNFQNTGHFQQAQQAESGVARLLYAYRAIDTLQFFGDSFPAN